MPFSLSGALHSMPRAVIHVLVLTKPPQQAWSNPSEASPSHQEERSSQQPETPK